MDIVLEYKVKFLQKIVWRLGWHGKEMSSGAKLKENDVSYKRIVMSDEQALIFRLKHGYAPKFRLYSIHKNDGPPGERYYLEYIFTNFPEGECEDG